MDDRLTIKTTLLRTKESTIATLPETEGKELTDLVLGAKELLLFTATAQNTWDISKFIEWKYQVELTILDGMNKVFRASQDDKFLKLIFGAQEISDGALKNKKINVRGLQICHELMLSYVNKSQSNVYDNTNCCRKGRNMSEPQDVPDSDPF